MVPLKLLAADASIARTIPEDLPLSTVNVFPCSRYVHSGNSSSSSPSLILQLHRSGYEGRDARACNGFSVGWTQATSFHDSRSTCKGREKRSSAGITMESIVKSRNRKYSCFQRKLEVNRYHGWTFSQQGDPCFRHSCTETFIVCGIHVVAGACRRGSARCFLANFLKKGFFTGEEEEKQRQRDRQRALLSLCAQAMVASHMAQSPLLSFLWASMPNVVSKLHEGRQGATVTNLLNQKEEGIRETGWASLPCWSCWKGLLLGFLFGTLISAIFTSAVSVGTLLDAYFWLCLLCSMLFPVAYMMQSLFFTMMSIRRGGGMTFYKSPSEASHRNIRMSLFQGLFLGASRFACQLLLTKECSKHKAQTAHLFIPSLWTRPSPMAENHKLGTMRKGRLRQVCSKLQSILTV